MPRQTLRPIAILCLVIALLSVCGCSPSPTPLPTGTLVPTHIPTAISTSTPIPSPTPTHTPVATPTRTRPPTVPPTPTLAPAETATAVRTPIPDALVEQILDTYNLLVFVQINAELLYRIAEGVTSGEIYAPSARSYIQAVEPFLQLVKDTAPQTVPPKVLASALQAALDLHARLEDIEVRWLAKEVNAAHVLAELSPIVEEIADVVQGAEGTLAQTYDVDAEQLAARRQELLSTFPDLFSPTPTPQG